jgi:glycosyltransferase involved in cell wall biosynthesis
MGMKFSIITPSFNQGRFIRDCLESVLMQVHAADPQPSTSKPQGSDLKVEHIVMDACSTDGTVEILEQWKAANSSTDSFSFDYVSERDKGQTDAINKGFRRATGDWVMWLNADDYLLSDALSGVMRFARENSNLEVVYGDCEFVDEQKRLLRIKREPDFDFWMLLFFGCYIPSTATFLRRTIVEADNLLDDSLKVCMDYEYYLRLAEKGFRFGHLPSVLAAFRWHGSNVSTLHGARRMEERLKVQKQHMTQQRLGFLHNELMLRCLRFLYQMRRVGWRTRQRLIHFIFNHDH